MIFKTPTGGHMFIEKCLKRIPQTSANADLWSALAEVWAWFSLLIIFYNHVIPSGFKKSQEKLYFLF
jgi:hypothetical protein